MANYQTSIDIANRALQHCGASRIVDFTDDSKNASAVAFCYDKLREAELRRNVWSFSIREVALRAVDATTTFLAAVAWAIGTTYTAGAVVSYQGATYESTASGNVGQTPGLDASAWELYAGPRTIRAFLTNTGGTLSDVGYFSGELVLSAGVVYRSLISNNTDIPPTANWLSLGAASAALYLLYPLGAGPASQNSTRNVFLYPGAYLREAPQDPKGGNVSPLGASGLTAADDWNFENRMIVSGSAQVIVLRFAASVTRVPAMDPMFCEGLAARIGLEVCEDLTQSAEKLQTIGSQYKLFMSEARQVNGIEEGPVESPEDDYITCRN